MTDADRYTAHDASPLVTAVVLTYNEADDTIACVRSLLADNYPNLRVVIVDNGSTDGGLERIRRAFPAIEVIQRARNGGYASGNNAGIRFALRRQSDYVLISNSDVVVQKGFLTPLVDVAERAHDVGVVIGTIRYQANPEEIYYAAGKFSRLLCTGMNRTRRSSSAAQQDKTLDVTFVNGALLLFRKTVFETLGLFDERFFLYFDDLEFSRRYATRYRLVYTPKSIVFHKSGAGKGWKSYTESYLYYNTRNRYWVFASDPGWYRIYVSIFNILNAMAKTAVLVTNLFSAPHKTARQLHALWRGVRDGFFRRPST